VSEESSQLETAESRQHEAEESTGVGVEEDESAEQPPTRADEQLAGRRDELTPPVARPVTGAPPAEEAGQATPPTHYAPAQRRRFGLVAVLVAAIAVIVLGFAVLGGGDGGDGDGSGREIEFEELSTVDYKLEVPTGWERIADQESSGSGQTRLRDPDGEMLLGINHFPSEGLSPGDYVLQQEAEKAVEDDQYVQREMDETEAPTGEPGVYWEFDADQPQIEGEEPSRVYAYVFDFGGTLYRIQCGAILSSGQEDVAEEVARRGVDTIEVF
jgi:hypothetical protein